MLCKQAVDEVVVLGKASQKLVGLPVLLDLRLLHPGFGSPVALVCILCVVDCRFHRPAVLSDVPECVLDPKELVVDAGQLLQRSSRRLRQLLVELLRPLGRTPDGGTFAKLAVHPEGDAKLENVDAVADQSFPLGLA